MTDAEGRTGTTEYDALHRPIETTNPLSGTTTYTYDEVGNLIQVVNPKSQTSNLQYDALNRLVVATDALSGTTTYSYDEIGNVVQIVNPKALPKRYPSGPITGDHCNPGDHRSRHCRR